MVVGFEEMQGTAKEWPRVASMKALAAFQKFKADKDFMAHPWAPTYKLILQLSELTVN